MEAIGTSATAMLVDTPMDARGRPDAVSVTLAREEIEEALASDEPLDLILSVDPGSGAPKDVRIGWDRTDLETVLSGADAGGITFSFDRAELYRALEHPDFEGHGIREMVLLTVAAASASAALAASTASGQLLEGTGGGTGGAVAAVQPGDPGTIPYLSHGVGVDESLFQGDTAAQPTAQPAEAGTIPYLSQGIGVDQTQFQGEASPAGTAAEPGTIPYLSQGTGVDQSQFQGEAPAGNVATPAAHDEASTASELAAPAAIHDEAGAAARGVGQTIPGADEAGLTARGLDPAIATAIGAHDEATTGRDLATPAIHDEAGAAARGVGQTIPGADEATLTVRGIEASPAVHDEATLVGRGVESPAVTVDSGGGSLELPALDSGAAAAIGGLAGAGLLIVGAAFVARRRTTPA